MIAYLVTETREKYERSGGHAIKLKLESISGEPCLVQCYEDASLVQLMELGVRALVFSGYTTALDDRELDSFRGVYEIVRDGNIPTIGLCGGHQMIAELWAPHNDAALTRMGSYPIRKLRQAEPDYNPSYHPGQFKEWGFHPVTVVREDPLFDGVPNPFMVSERHMREVKELPSEFYLLASTDQVRVQAYRHKDKILYGTQFHPESWTDYYPAGRTILENFFRIAGIL